MTSTAASTQTRASTMLDNLNEGLTIFSVTPDAVAPLPPTHALPPLLTSDGTPEHLALVLDCFVRWDGKLKVAALQDEGLLDVWVF